MTTARLHLYISGQVQGVLYRASCRREGESLRLVGWVRNLPDGRVEAVAEGESGALDKWVAWCRRGPPGAQVEGVEVIREEPKGKDRGFRVTR